MRHMPPATWRRRSTTNCTSPRSCARETAAHGDVLNLCRVLFAMPADHPFLPFAGATAIFMLAIPPLFSTAARLPYTATVLRWVFASVRIDSPPTS